jgi:hypothetical protein
MTVAFASGLLHRASPCLWLPAIAQSMRYRRELGVTRVGGWLALGAFLSAGLFRKGHPLWVALFCGFAATLLFYIPHFFWYWDILPDRVVHRRYFRRSVFPFSEITYVGPLTGWAAGNNAVRNWILIRNAAGERIVATPADPEAFLANIRKHLPLITLNL